MCEQRHSEDIPKYVLKDIEILFRYEYESYDKYGFQINKDDKIALKLFRIANKYPQKHLWAILEYFGYFCGEEELAEENYRDEIRHIAEEYFKRAMNDALLMYDGGVNGNIRKQIPFIEIGVIGGWFSNVHNWREKLSLGGYTNKYPQKSVDL